MSKPFCLRVKFEDPKRGSNDVYNALDAFGIGGHETQGIGDPVQVLRRVSTVLKHLDYGQGVIRKALQDEFAHDPELKAALNK